MEGRHEATQVAWLHTSLRVIGVLSDLEVCVVLGFCFYRWVASEPVHQPARVYQCTQMQASRKPTVSEQVSKPRNNWTPPPPEGRRAKE